MTQSRICFFNLSDNFHGFFIPLARELEARGFACNFLNFWPRELASLSKNGMADCLLDWQSGFPGAAEPVSDADLDRWIGFDPRYLAMAPADRVAERERFRRAAAHLRPMFRRLLRQHAITTVFFWNGYRFPEPILRDVCAELGVATVFGENGFFSHTMQLDRDGINAASSLGRRPLEQWLGVDPADEPRFAEFLRAGGNLPPVGTPLAPILPVVPRDQVASLLRPFISQRALYDRLPRRNPLRGMVENRRIAQLKRQRPTSRGAALPDRYLFLAFQVHDDTQIVIHSPWVPSMQGMVEAMMAARAAGVFDQAMVVKEHPVDVGRIDYTELRARAESAGVTWLWDYPLDKVMDGADAVVTVNSSVGVEAIVRGKPLVTLGNAFYNLPGICHHAASAEELPGAIRAALAAPPDDRLRHAFLAKLRFRDMVEASWSRPTDVGINAAAGRIAALVG